MASAVKSVIAKKGGSKCHMTGDGSGSVTRADAVQCATAPNACSPAPVAQEEEKENASLARHAVS